MPGAHVLLVSRHTVGSPLRQAGGVRRDPGDLVLRLHQVQQRGAFHDTQVSLCLSGAVGVGGRSVWGGRRG